jgi:hypothetical protein
MSPVPPEFRIDRAAKLGRHPLLEVFPGLEALDAAARQLPKRSERERLHRETFVEIVRRDVWMYVAPREIPPGARPGWKPVTSGDVDCVVIGRGHLRESPELTLYLDIFHELCHVIQRWNGRELFPQGVSYVGRSTEIDAYRFVVDEARRRAVPDEVLRDYLRVEWIDDDEFGQLLDAVGVSRSG